MTPAKNMKNKFGLAALAIIIGMMINPALGAGLMIFFIFALNKNFKMPSSGYQKIAADILGNLTNINIKSGANVQSAPENEESIIRKITAITPLIASPSFGETRLARRKKYLQVALNSTIGEAGEVISQLPASDRILIEAGTPLIKIYGADAISQIRAMAPAGTYIVADNKCADLAAREVEMMTKAGANASTCLGVAPIETINIFIEECKKFNIDSMIDMMNVENSLAVLKKLKQLPDVVVLHRGVDESEFSREKQIPYYQIKQIKGNYNLMVAVAGGDTIKEVQRAIFNDADIVVVWKNFYQPTNETANLAASFLREIK